jgi:hypothetical protein
MSIFDKLDQEATSKQQAAEQRRQQAAEAAEQRRELDRAWGQAIAACDTAAFLELGRLLKARGYDAYLPAIIATRQQAMDNGDQEAPAELCVAESLRLACDAKPKRREIAKRLATAAKLAGDGLAFHVGAIHDYLELRHEHGGELPKVEELPTATPPAQQTTAVSELKGVARRDAWFLQQYDARGTDTYHKPAKIHAKWEGMTATARAEICPTSPNKIAKGTVESAIKRGRKERNG